MNKILKGLRIIEGSAFVAAPSAGMTLAQMGAEVIRFDPRMLKVRFLSARSVRIVIRFRRPLSASCGRIPMSL